VFDLSRSIEAHQDSAEGTDERAVAGVIRGLVGLNDEVTWEARHFGFIQKLTIRVTAFDRPQHFQDILISGAFKRMVHNHEFLNHLGGTLMIDHFEFQSPLSVFGTVFDWLFLTRHMRRFLLHRNSVLKKLAESQEWTRYLGPS
jgi:ligand-binding SRPBCC domain-containing protein